MLVLSAHFSEDYASARQRFCENAQQSDARLFHLVLPQKGSQGEELAIDIAWLGSDHPKKVLIHSSGLHGVEGFAGSAIQNAILTNPPYIPDDTAVVLVHILNPWGMSWSRRVNENNVDLNRNFLKQEQNWEGEPEGYQYLNNLINPPSGPGYDFFYLRSALKIASFGFARIKQAIAQGQYEYPQGLFFGGKELQQSAALYKQWLQENLSDAEKVLVIDVHTGLGKFGFGSLFLEKQGGAVPRQLYQELLKEHVINDHQNSIAYVISGGLECMFEEIFSNIKMDFILQEFGTYPGIKVLHALREENRWHHYVIKSCYKRGSKSSHNSGNMGSDKMGDKNYVHHATKSRIKEVFNPSSLKWQQSILEQGRAVFDLSLKQFSF